LSSGRRSRNPLLDAANLIAAGIATALMGVVAVVGAIAWSDASVLLLGLSTLAIGLALVIQGWLRIRRFARTFPDDVSARASPIVPHSAPLERWKRTVLTGAFLLPGIQFICVGVFLIAGVQQFGVEILLLGSAFTAIGLRGFMSLLAG